MSDIRPVPGDTDGLDELRRLAAIGYGICLSTATVQETLVPMLAEYDRRGAEIEQRRAALCRALAIPDHTPWEAALESARSAGVVRDAEYRTRDRVEAENARLREELDAAEGPGSSANKSPVSPDGVLHSTLRGPASAMTSVDRPVLDGVHALALGSIARDIGLTAEASGALVALTVADRMEELERLRGQRDAALALHERREAASAAGGSTVWCEGCSARKGEIVSWPCADARALGVEEGTDV